MNNIKIFRGKSTSVAKQILGVDLDSFSLTTTLDETFDTGTFNIVTTNANARKLKSRDYITIQEFENNTLKHQEQYRIDVVGDTVIKQVSGVPTYEYQVTFLEKTSELQDIKCPNVETCQPLPPYWKENVSGVTEYESYGTTPTYIMGIFKAYRMRFDTSYNVEVRKYASQGTNTAELQIPPFKRAYAINIKVPVYMDESEYYMLVTNSSGTEVVSDYYSTLSQTTTYLPVGTYKIRIYYKNSKLFSTDKDWKKNCIFFAYNLEIVANSGASRQEIGDKYHTTYEILQKLIWTIKPYKTTNGVPTNPKYTLNADCDFLKNELCPDLYLTGNDLYTNLLLIGRTCNCIPYLDDNDSIHMLNLGSMESLPNGFSKSNFNSFTTISDYDRCGAVVTDLQNMVANNKLDNKTCTDTWRTLECEVGNQFTADSCFYRSDFNIYQLKDFRIKYWDGNNTYLGEVSALKYMFESTIYNCLDSTSTSTRNSRSYALCYSQYANKITGFTNQSSEYSLTQLSVHSSICYILRDLFGIIINNDLIQNWHNRIMCQAIYEPVIDARVKQYRQDAKDFNDNELLLSQQTNLGSMELVGESMKNSHAQTGNLIQQQNTFVTTYANIPQINQCFIDGSDIWKVSKVVRAFSNTGYNLAIVYTKNFNRVSANQSLATEKRWADVPLSGAIKRTILLEDYALFYKDNVSISTKNWTDKYLANVDGNRVGLLSVLDENVRNYGVDKPLSFYFRLKSKDGTTYPNTKTCLADGVSDYSWIRLPVVVGAFGNSIFVKATCKDNYSATTGLITRSIGGTNYKFAIDIPYCDDNGEGLLLDFKIGCKKQTLTTFSQTNCFEESPTTNDYIIASGNNIYINKGSREQLEFVYQLHFLSGDSDVLIGKAMTQCNMFAVSKESLEKRSLDLYVINHRLTSFEQNLPSDSVRIGSSAAEALHIYTASCDIDSEYQTTTFDELFGDDTNDEITIGLYATYPMSYYDERSESMKSELIVGRTLKRYQFHQVLVKDYRFAKAETLADYPF